MNFTSYRLLKTVTACILLSITVLIFIAAKPLKSTQIATQVGIFYSTHLDSLQFHLHSFNEKLADTSNFSVNEVKTLFAQCRYEYKKIECLTEYFFATAALNLNGPAIVEAEPSEPNEPQHPTGFQVLEELVFGDAPHNMRMQMQYEISNIINRVNYLQRNFAEPEIDKTVLLDAIKLEVYRIITKGISGFDSPVAEQNIQELLPTLQSIKTLLSFFPLSAKMVQKTELAIHHIQSYKSNFDNFNRTIFIQQYLNAISQSIAQYQVTAKISFVTDRRAIRPTANTLFEPDAVNILFYAPSGTTPATKTQIALGYSLFNEKLLSSNAERSCRSCHEPEKAFTDGLKVNYNLLDKQPLLRNTPSLINAGMQPVLFYDGRISFLEDQVHDVISSKAEMNGNFETIVSAISLQKKYRTAFNNAYRQMPTANLIRQALAAYVRSLIALNSPFDKYMNGNKQAMNSFEIAGLNVFLGKAKCGSCHYMPTFSGSVPPLYDKMENEVLGVPASSDTMNAIPDTDSGKYQLYNIPSHLHAFKTPSLRNVALTAPYMHNGVYATLEQVIDFYNRGGGRGIGVDFDNQTLPDDRLNLTDTEQKQLIAFLKCLTDTAITKRNL